MDKHNASCHWILLSKAKAEAAAAGKDPESVHLLVLAEDDFDKDSAFSRSTFDGDFDSLVPKEKDKTGGLSSSIHLVRGMPVMLRQNVDVRDGLVNGSCGTVVHWTKGGKVVFIKFGKVSGRTVGLETRRKHREYLAGPLEKDHRVVPIVKAEASFMSKKGNYQLRRLAFPLVPSWASTIHKAQGMSLQRVVIDLSSNTIPAASAYVALSRVTSLAGLFLIGFCAGAIKADAPAAMEMDRLRKAAMDLHMAACDCPKGDGLVCRVAESLNNYDGAGGKISVCTSSEHGKRLKVEKQVCFGRLPLH